jgi:hypothetical protein
MDLVGLGPIINPCCEVLARLDISQLGGWVFFKFWAFGFITYGGVMLSKEQGPASKSRFYGSFHGKSSD